MERTQQFLERYRSYQDKQLEYRTPVAPEQPLTALAIDGGGVRGLIPARLLERIEDRTGKPIWECFDMISGTSTGGLITLGLTVPNGTGSARWSASDLVEMYRGARKTIFPPNVLRSLGSLLFDKYATTGLERELARRLGDNPLTSALTGVVVTAWNLTDNRPAYFNSAEAGEFFANPLMRQVGRATSAAPSYFAPCWIAEPSQQAKAFVDGGTFANNPAKIAYEALRPPQARSRPLLLLSLGTGNPVSEDPRRRRLWGALPWVRPMVRLFMMAPSELVDAELRQLTADPHFNYYRLEPKPGEASSKLDDASEDNIHALDQLAQELIADNCSTLDQICDVLRQRPSRGTAAPGAAP